MVKWCSLGNGILVSDVKCCMVFHFLNLSLDVNRHTSPCVSVINIGLLRGGHVVVWGVRWIFLDCMSRNHGLESFLRNTGNEW